ncbi:TetR/AcrR family transcriptional regulator [Nonomuraea purpurea]|uniref:TetR/AcrR family transcriptional regulator n=1 Tax=Nonomuraea purpurea TaxID=1849276 RepID=A0ABV8GPL4_9ACTN
MPRVSQKHRDARRRQVIDAARRCFTRSGFSGTSMQDIFEESGLSAGAVYGYFAGKEELAMAIIDEVLTEITAGFDAVFDADEPPPPDEVLGRLFGVLDRELARLAVQVWAESLTNAELTANLRGHYRALEERFVQLATMYRQRGVADPAVPPEHTARVLTSLGPAFVFQLALLDGVDAESFRRGLKAMLKSA